MERIDENLFYIFLALQFLFFFVYHLLLILLVSLILEVMCFVSLLSGDL